MGNLFQLTVDQPPNNVGSDEKVFDRQSIVAQAIRAGLDQIVESSHELSEDIVTIDPDMDDRFDGRVPVVIYSPTASSLESLKADLLQVFGPRLRCVIQAVPDSALENPWVEGEWHGFSAGKFRVEICEDGATERAKFPNIIKVIRGDAFGLGNHATTRACLTGLSHIVPTGNPQDSSCLDIGTGNGILLIAAGKQGFGRLVGTDIEETILSEAQRNLSLNGANAELLCREDLPNAQYDLVMCNILFPLLHQMLEDIVQRVSNSGKLLLGGFPDSEVARLQERLSHYGFESIAWARDLYWPCLVGWRRGTNT